MQMPSDKACPITTPSFESLRRNRWVSAAGARASQVVDAEQDFARRTRKCHPHSHGKKSPIFGPELLPRFGVSPNSFQLMGYFSGPRKSGPLSGTPRLPPAIKSLAERSLVDIRQPSPGQPFRGLLDPEWSGGFGGGPS